MKGTRPLDNDEIRSVSTCFTGTFATRNRGLFMLGVSTGGRISELMKRLMTLLVVFVITASPIYAGLDQLTVRAVYLTPTDETEPLEEEISQKRNILIDVQRFYGKEMNKRGYGYKTFNLEKNDNNRVVIHKIKGKRTLKQYEKLELIRGEVNAIFGNPFNIGAEDVIWVVFLTGAEQIKGGAQNIGMCFLWEGVDSVCSDHSLIPANKEIMLSHLTAHELGHAFGLNHNEGGGIISDETIR